jgi:hypothetical protein
MISPLIPNGRARSSVFGQIFHEGSNAVMFVRAVQDGQELYGWISLLDLKTFAEQEPLDHNFRWRWGMQKEFFARDPLAAPPKKDPRRVCANCHTLR